MFELVRNARMVWLGVLEVAGLLETGTTQQEDIDLNALVVRDTERLTAAVRKAIEDDEELAAVQRYRSRPMAVLTGWPTGSLSSLSSRKASIVEPLNWRCGSCPSNGGRSDLVRLVLTTPHRTTLSRLTGNRLRPIWWARVVHQTEPTDDQAGDEPAVRK